MSKIQPTSVSWQGALLQGTTGSPSHSFHPRRNGSAPPAFEPKGLAGLREALHSSQLCFCLPCFVTQVLLQVISSPLQSWGSFLCVSRRRPDFADGTKSMGSVQSPGCEQHRAGGDNRFCSVSCPEPTARTRGILCLVWHSSSVKGRNDEGVWEKWWLEIRNSVHCMVGVTKRKLMSAHITIFATLAPFLIRPDRYC